MNTSTSFFSAQTSIGDAIARAYVLLAGTIAVTAGMSFVGARVPFAWQHPIILALAGLGCLLLVFFLGGRDSPAAIPAVFGFAALEGLSLGPLLTVYAAMPGGPAVIAQATGATAVIFLGLSAYAFKSRRDFSFLGGFLFVGLILLVLASVANIWLHIPALHLALAAVSALIFSGYVLYDTSRLANQQVLHPVLIVVGLYLDILNLFLALLQLLGVLSRRN